MKFGKVFAVAALILLSVVLLTLPTFASAGNVSTAIEGTWDTAKTEVKTVVDNVVFPVLDLVLAVLFFVKLGGSYFEYRKHGLFASMPSYTDRVGSYRDHCFPITQSCTAKVNNAVTEAYREACESLIY
jgi:hypothetical protein